ncbi:hypothetical protein [Flavobacterium sp. HNIBRBA15423]|uniref:hypothetical protein n=1 Tax=Flavobacterium sp. HNIBRBA15423 TaxID=3458683 RepID=UPI00404405DA
MLSFNSTTRTVYDVLSGETVSASVSVHTIGWGFETTYTNAIDNSFRIIAAGPSISTTPGVSSTVTSSKASFSDTKVISKLKTEQDSIEFAKEKVKKYPNSNIFQRYLDGKKAKNNSGSGVIKKIDPSKL